LLGGFAWKLFAFKAEFNAFTVGAVADFAELVFHSHTADAAVGACAALHFGAFLAGDTANTNLHVQTSIDKKVNSSLIYQCSMFCVFLLLGFFCPIFIIVCWFLVWFIFSISR
jgi:hypothetical protein